MTDSPWKLDDAPPDFLDQLANQVVSIELTVTHLLGQWTVSQHRSAQNRAGANAGLRSHGVTFNGNRRGSRDRRVV
ncbi:hypothetical protein KQH49_08290 [Mycetohabitans sp. B5]|nr:hypothetical protein [Mycetohabitans sp. B5]